MKKKNCAHSVHASVPVIYEHALMILKIVFVFSKRGYVIYILHHQLYLHVVIVTDFSRIETVFKTSSINLAI